MDILDAVLHFPSETSCIFKVNKAYSLPFIQGFFNVGHNARVECVSLHVCVCACVQSVLFNKSELSKINQIPDWCQEIKARSLMVS